jgi:hypothetical protein
MKTKYLFLVLLSFSFLSSLSQERGYTHYNGDLITKFSNTICNHDTSYRDSLFLFYCKDGYEAKESTSGSGNDIRKKMWVSNDNNHIWFSSTNGLTHYDRLKDEWFRFAEKGRELPSNFVKNVTGDSVGNVWCTYDFGLGLTRITGDETQTYNVTNSNLGSNSIGAIGVNKQGVLYISTGGGLYTYDAIADSFNLVHNRYGDVMAFSGDTVYLAYAGSGTLFSSWHSPSVGTYKRDNNISGLSSGDLSDLVVYPNRDTVLISTYSQGIFCLDASLFRFTSIKTPYLNSNKVNHMQLLDDDSIWVDNSDGFTKFKKSNIYSFKHKSTISDFTRGSDYFVNSQHEIWVLNQQLELYKDSLIPFSTATKRGLKQEQNATYKCKNGDIISTVAEKHFVFRNQKWEQFGNGLYTSPNIGYIKELPNGELWLIVSYIWAGYPQIFVYDSKYTLLRTYDDTNTSVNAGILNDVVVLPSGNVYMSTLSGLLEYDFVGDSFNLYDNSNSNLTYSNTFDLTVDKNNWLYVLNGRLNRYDGSDFMELSSQTNIAAIDVDKDNNLWGLKLFGTNSDRFQLIKFTQISRDDYLPTVLDTLLKDGNLKDFRIDYDNNPVVVFENSLYIYKDENFAEEVFPTLMPKITGMQLYTKGRCYSSEKGSYDIIKEYNDTLGKYDDGLFHVSGHVFYDKNSDGLLNNQDQGLNLRKIRCVPDNVVLYSNAKGHYQFAFESTRIGDTIQLIHENDHWWKSQPDTQTIVLGHKSERIFIRNFPCSFTNLDSNTRIETTLTSMNCNDSSSLIISYENFSRADDAGIINVWIDSLCSGDSFSTYHHSFRYEIDDLEAKQRVFKIMLPSATYSDSVLRFTTQLSSTTYNYILNDTLEIALNCDSLNLFKSNTPIGIGPSHVIPIPSNIKYSIVYNNTTGDVIKSLVFRDTLDENLVWKSFKLDYASHSVNTILENGIVNFIFRDIDLLSGSQNDLKNTLYVSYSIDTKSSLDWSTYIHNRCVLFLNDSVSYSTQNVFNSSEADTSTNSINEGSGTRNLFSFYPNPTAGKLILENKSSFSQGTILIFDTKGLVLGSHKLSAKKVELDLGNESPGIYFIQLISADGVLLMAHKAIKY